MKPSKLIWHLETKHPNHATKSYRILSTWWSEFETSETYLDGCFYQEDKHRMKSHLKLPSKKLTPLEKNACETCLLETVKLLLGKTNKVNMRQISFFSDIDQRFTSDLMLLHVISCLFSWLVFNRETLRSCFVKNCNYTNADVREK